MRTISLYQLYVSYDIFLYIPPISLNDIFFSGFDFPEQFYENFFFQRLGSNYFENIFTQLTREDIKSDIIDTVCILNIHSETPLMCNNSNVFS